MLKLEYYRKKIDGIDKKIVRLLLIRLNLVRTISKIKKSNKINIIDRKRELKVLNNIKSYSKQHKKFVLGIFKKIIVYSKKIQK